MARLMKLDVKQEIEQAQAGCLITQIAPVEFRELVVQLLDKSLDIDTLCQSDRKKDRILAKKLLLLINLLHDDTPNHLATFATLLNTKWKTLFFRSRGNGAISVELKIR